MFRHRLQEIAMPDPTHRADFQPLLEVEVLHPKTDLLSRSRTSSFSFLVSTSFSNLDPLLAPCQTPTSRPTSLRTSTNHDFKRRLLLIPLDCNPQEESGIVSPQRILGSRKRGEWSVSSHWARTASSTKWQFSRDDLRDSNHSCIVLNDGIHIRRRDQQERRSILAFHRDEVPVVPSSHKILLSQSR